MTNIFTKKLKISKFSIYFITLLSICNISSAMAGGQNRVSESGSGKSRTDQMKITAMVESSCSITASDLNFGSYTGEGLVDGTTTLTVTCTNTTPYYILIDKGAGSSITQRRMSGPGSDRLNYQLYQDNSRSNIWGDTSTTRNGPKTGNGLPQSWTVYGRIPTGQLVQPGSYNDTVQVTVTF